MLRSALFFAISENAVSAIIEPPTTAKKVVLLSDFSSGNYLPNSSLLRESQRKSAMSDTPDITGVVPEKENSSQNAIFGSLKGFSKTAFERVCLLRTYNNNVYGIDKAGLRRETS